MKPLKIAMLSLTHGHTRKYYQTLKDSPKLDWVAATAENDAVEQRFRRAVTDVPCYRDEAEMFDRHPEIEAVVLASGQQPARPADGNVCRAGRAHPVDEDPFVRSRRVRPDDRGG